MLSLLFLSCKRLHFLERTVTAIRHHMASIEPDIKPTYICFDNGSSAEDHARLHALGFDELILSRTNLGIGPAMNHLISAVRTPYILNLQDDWVVENPQRVPFIRCCRQICEHDANIAHVKLDACHFLDFQDRHIYDGPFGVDGMPLPFFIQNPRMMWGGFSFPPAVTRTDAMLQLGPFREDHPYRRGWAESEFSSRFTQRFVAAKSPKMALFRHIGDEASPGWDQDARPDSARSPGPGGDPIAFAAPSPADR